MPKQLFYVSRVRHVLSEFEVRAILETSRRNNRRADITGCLLFSGRHFAQILEGEDSAVTELTNRVRADPRHIDMTIAFEKQIDTRRYQEWSMGYLYRHELADEIEALLQNGAGFERIAAMMSRIEPDSVMGRL
jgi:Sensors of blue-light using FAD